MPYLKFAEAVGIFREQGRSEENKDDSRVLDASGKGWQSREVGKEQDKEEKVWEDTYKLTLHPIKLHWDFCISVC